MLAALVEFIGGVAYIILLVAGIQQGGTAACAAGLATLGLAILLAGFVGDLFYNRKVHAGVAEYRLPFWLRWDSWDVGSLVEDGDILGGRDFLNRKYYDWRFDKVVDIYHFMPMERAPRTT